MSIEANLNNAGIIHQNMRDKINEELKKDKEDKIKIEYELKIRQMKEKLKCLLKNALGKNLLYLEEKTKEHIQILTSTTKRYNNFNKKIRLLTKQVEENKKRKEESKPKLKKLKDNSSKIRSKTVQIENRGKLHLLEQKSSITNLRTRKINNNSNYKLINENINSIKKIRSKTVDPHESLKQNSAKKPNKNISLVLHSKKNLNSNFNNNIKIKKYNSGKFYFTEQNFNQNKKLISEKKKKKKNNISKPKKNINSSSNILTSSKDKSEKNKISNKRIIKKDSFKEVRKSQDFTNKFIPKPKKNNNNNKEKYSEKKINSNKKYIKDNDKKKSENDNESKNILKRFEKQKEMLENIRKQREIFKIKEEEKKKEKDKEREEERINEEERKEKEREEKIKIEERMKEEERRKEEERKKIQMKLEAEIEREKIDKENIKKEMEKKREEEKMKNEFRKKKEIEKKKEFERQKEIERKKETEKKIIEKNQKEEEKEICEKKKEESLRKELEKIKEEEKKKEELPQKLNYENLILCERNDNIDIQDLLELEEQTDNSEFIHMNEDKQKEINSLEDEKIFVNSTPSPESKPTSTPLYYRNISIFELIHDAHSFGPCLFHFLDLKDLIEFTSTSKKIKKQRIYVFNLQKNKLLQLIGMDKEEILKNKILEYEEKYSKEELNEPYIKFQMSKGALRAIKLLNNDIYSKIFRRPLLDNKYCNIYIVYRILFLFLGEFEIADILDDKLFWVKCSEYLNSNSEGKIGDFIIKKIEERNYDNKTIYKVEKILNGKKDNIIIPSYFSKSCPSTGLIIFLIKELLEYCGIIISNKKTQLCRVYNNYKYYQAIENKLSEFNQSIENN